MSQYPHQIDNSNSLPIAIDNQVTVSAYIFNKLRDAVIAIEETIGIEPSGGYNSVAEAMQYILNFINSPHAPVDAISLGVFTNHSNNKDAHHSQQHPFNSLADHSGTLDGTRITEHSISLNKIDPEVFNQITVRNAEYLGGIAASEYSLINHEHPEYLKKNGDTVTGTLTLLNETPIIAADGSDICPNLNVEFLGGHKASDFLTKNGENIITVSAGVPLTINNLGVSATLDIQENNNSIFKINPAFIDINKRVEFNRTLTLTADVPLIVHSDQKIENLNADLLDNFHAVSADTASSDITKRLNVLVATDSDGLLPTSIIPGLSNGNIDKVDGFDAVPATSVDKQEVLVATDAQGKLPADIIPDFSGLDAGTINGVAAVPISGESALVPQPFKLMPLGPDEKFPLSVIPQGPGSGLDADTLESRHADFFAEVNHTHSEYLTVNGINEVTNFSLKGTAIFYSPFTPDMVIKFNSENSGIELGQLNIDALSGKMISDINIVHDINVKYLNGHTTITLDEINNGISGLDKIPVLDANGVLPEVFWPDTFVKTSPDINNLVHNNGIIAFGEVGTPPLLIDNGLIIDHDSTRVHDINVKKIDGYETYNSTNKNNSLVVTDTQGLIPDEVVNSVKSSSQHYFISIVNDINAAPQASYYLPDSFSLTLSRDTNNPALLNLTITPSVNYNKKWIIAGEIANGFNATADYKFEVSSYDVDWSQESSPYVLQVNNGIQNSSALATYITHLHIIENDQITFQNI